MISSGTGVRLQNSRSHFQLLGWRHAANDHVGSVVIICLDPAGCDILHFLDAVEDVEVQPLVAHRAVITLYLREKSITGFMQQNPVPL